MDDIVKELRSLVQPMIFDSRPVDAQIVGDALDYISRLEAVVRALDDTLRDATAEEITAMLDVDRGLAWGKLVAARSRVTLPPLTQTNQAKDGDKEDATNAT